MSLSFRKYLCLGSILVNENGDYYCYLGHYRGVPRSIFAVPNEGFLYLYMGSIYRGDYRLWLQHELNRLQQGIDGNGLYTKNPKGFSKLVGVATGLNEEFLRNARPFGLYYDRVK